MAITIEELQSQIEDLQSELTESGRLGTGLLQQLEETRGRIADLEQKLESQARRFEDESAELKSAAGWAMVDQQRLRIQLASVSASEAVAVAQLDDDQDVVAEKDKEVQMIKGRLREQSQEIIRLRAAVDAAVEIDREHGYVQSLQARLTLLEGAKLEYDKEKVELEKQKVVAEERAADLESQLTALREQNVELLRKAKSPRKAGFSKDAATITTTARPDVLASDKFDELRVELQRVGQRLENAQKVAAEAASRAVELTAAVAAAKAVTVEQAEKYGAELAVVRQAHTAEQVELTAAVAAAQKAAAEAEAALSAAQKAHVAENTKLTAAADAVKAELAAAKAETAEQATIHVAELAAAKAVTVEQAEKYGAELAAVRQVHTAEQAELTAAVAAAQKAAVEAEAALSAAQKAHVAENTKLTAAADAVKAELAAAKAVTVEQAEKYGAELAVAQKVAAEAASRVVELTAAVDAAQKATSEAEAELAAARQTHAAEKEELTVAADAVKAALAAARQTHAAEKEEFTASAKERLRSTEKLSAKKLRKLAEEVSQANEREKMQAVELEAATAEIIELKRQLAQAQDAAGAVQSPITPFRTRTSQDAALQTAITTTPVPVQTCSDQWVQFETLTFQNKDSYFVKRDSSSVKAEVRSSANHNKIELALEVFLTMYLAGSNPGSTPTVYAKGSDPELVALYYAYAKLFEAAGMKIAITGSVPNQSQLAAATNKITSFFYPDAATAEAVDASALGKKIVSLYMAPKGCADAEITEFLKTQLGYQDTNMSTKVKAAGGIYLAGQRPVTAENSLFGMTPEAGKQKFESIGLFEQVEALLKFATVSEYDNPDAFISGYSGSVVRTSLKR